MLKDAEVETWESAGVTDMHLRAGKMCVNGRGEGGVVGPRIDAAG